MAQVFKFLFPKMLSKKEKNFFIKLVLLPISKVYHFAELSPQLAPEQTVQECIGGKSM